MRIICTSVATGAVPRSCSFLRQDPMPSEQSRTSPSKLPGCPALPASGLFSTADATRNTVSAQIMHCVMKHQWHAKALGTGFHGLPLSRVSRGNPGLHEKRNILRADVQLQIRTLRGQRAMSWQQAYLGVKGSNSPASGRAGLAFLGGGSSVGLFSEPD